MYIGAFQKSGELLYICAIGGFKPQVRYLWVRRTDGEAAQRWATRWVPLARLGDHGTSVHPLSCSGPARQMPATFGDTTHMASKFRTPRCRPSAPASILSCHPLLASDAPMSPQHALLPRDGAHHGWPLQAAGVRRNIWHRCSQLFHRATFICPKHASTCFGIRPDAPSILVLGVYI